MSEIILKSAVSNVDLTSNAFQLKSDYIIKDEYDDLIIVAPFLRFDTEYYDGHVFPYGCLTEKKPENPHVSLDFNFDSGILGLVRKISFTPVEAIVEIYLCGYDIQNKVIANPEEFFLSFEYIKRYNHGDNFNDISINKIGLLRTK